METAINEVLKVLSSHGGLGYKIILFALLVYMVSLYYVYFKRGE